MNKLNIKRTVIGSSALLLFLFSYWLWLDYREFLKQPIKFPTEVRALTLQKGSNINRLAKQLVKQGSIEYQWHLKLFAHLNPELKRLKAGEYQLDAMMLPESFLEKLTNGVVIQYSFTIIEGQTSFQVLEHLQNKPRLTFDKLLMKIGSNSYKASPLMKRLELTSSNIEGWLFPDTYYFSQGDSAFSITQRATSKMKQVLEEEWQQRDQNLPYKNAYQALIMASIIEKETGIASERAKIAGVFVRRLNKKMRLGTDPTVIYGIGPTFNGDITSKDLKTRTPYNTRIIKGLPPTPIAMPSRESINAALHPESGDSYYFVADGTGGHYFSETLKEHNLAVRRMLKRNKKR
jgi:UPF0755 protein